MSTLSVKKRTSTVVVVGHHRHQLWSSLASTVVVVSRQRRRHQPWLAVVVVAVIGSRRQSWRRARRRASLASHTSRGISRSATLRCGRPLAIVGSGRGRVAVNYRIEESIGVGLRAVVALVRSQRCRSRSRSKSKLVWSLHSRGRRDPAAVGQRGQFGSDKLWNFRLPYKY